MNSSTSPLDLKKLPSPLSEKAVAFAMAYSADILVSPLLTEREGYPRSPSRSRRRMAQGHPQHHGEIPSKKVYQMGHQLVMHPAMLEQLRRVMAAKMGDLERRVFLNPLLGQPPGSMTGRVSRQGPPDYQTLNRFDMSKLRELIEKLTPPGSKELWP